MRSVAAGILFVLPAYALLGGLGQLDTGTPLSAHTSQDAPTYTHSGCDPELANRVLGHLSEDTRVQLHSTGLSVDICSGWLLDSDGFYAPPSLKEVWV